MNNPIIFDEGKCKRCGLCAEVCPNKVICKKENKIVYSEEKAHLCFKCGQCMSICPTASICVNDFSYEKDFFDLPETENSEQGFLNLIETRRAVRNFKETPVPKDVLERLVKAMSFAPPGFPPLKVEIVVVQDPPVYRKASSIPLSY